jgi:glucosyl-3-phosphoglycerate synthase
VRPDVRAWTQRRSSTAHDWPRGRVIAAKSGRSVAVVIPARNEEATVGGIVATIHAQLPALVDELVVVDSCSTDATATAASDAGARVVRAERTGKGEALWVGLGATYADVVVFVDADLRSFTSQVVTGLVGPLLADPQTQLVKAAYDRPLGRVTELVARPLLSAHWPALAGFEQPLAGEYAGRRGLLERLPFPIGYGVEIAILIDALGLVGLDALAQVHVGRRVHRHHDDVVLGQMAAEVWHAAWRRLRLAPGSPELTQFIGGTAVDYELAVEERPPLSLRKDRPA